jgi:hypothetical protein
LSKLSLPVRFISAALLASLLVSTVPVTAAFAGDCDGTSGDDTVDCQSLSMVPDEHIGLELGDDVLLLHLSTFGGNVLGDGLPNGDPNIGDGGNDYILVDAVNPSGYVAGDFTNGNGGDDTILVYYISMVFGDVVTGAGGDDYIRVTGVAINGIFGDYSGGDGGSDTIILDGSVYAGIVAGDFTISGGHGGDDTIVINGSVFNGVDVCGDYLFGGGNGGNDTIIVNGLVQGRVMGDCVTTLGGNDTIIIANGATVTGLIDGEGGMDTLSFLAALQSDLDLLDPAGGTISIAGQNYTWLNFETLLGIVRAIAQSTHPEIRYRVIATGSAFIAMQSDDGLGVNVIGKNGRIGKILYTEIAKLELGESMNFKAANSSGWYLTVTNLGLNVNETTLFSVTIFDASHGLQGDFTFNH